jgi:hypothetical protein
MNDIAELVDLQALMTRLIEYLPRVGAAVFVFAVFWSVFRVVRRLLDAGLTKMDVHAAVRDLLVDKLFRYAVVLIAVVMAADQLGFNVAAALASWGLLPSGKRLAVRSHTALSLPGRPAGIPASSAVMPKNRLVEVP